MRERVVFAMAMEARGMSLGMAIHVGEYVFFSRD
jgi:hypothetical protein